jgi:outer membrane protein assembly factor BamB
MLLAFALAVLCGADWPTYRGSLRRTGSADSKPLPAPPQVVWAFPGPNHYVAAPAPFGRGIFLPALGPLNSPLVLALSAEEDAPERVAWTQGAPLLKLPPAASPVMAGDRVLFGEGMHQNAGGAVVALSTADGLPLWRVELAGELRHVEGSPALARGRVYFGAGSGGVVCVDPQRLRLESRDVTPEEARARTDARWKELLAAYKRDKKTDPDFAVPPKRSDLPVAAAAIAWSAGAERWHVDAPVAVVEGDPVRVLAGSAFLEDEQRGERALLCLDVRDGTLLWRQPLRWNPWGAPSLAERRGGAAVERAVLVGCSSIRYDPARIPEARGEVVAVDLQSGALRWQREVPGGVLSPVAVDEGGEVGFFTATDGLVRALRASDGEVLWSFPAGRPFFAGVCLAAGELYAADLEGGITALKSADGSLLWRLDISRDPRAGYPGRVYASPLLAGGQLYVATANIEGPHAGQPSVVVCIGERKRRIDVAGIAVDLARRRVEIDVRIAPRKLPHLDRIYPVEVLATAPQGKKAHETVLVTEVQPSNVHRAIEELGLRAGKPGIGDTRAEGPEVRLFLEFLGRDGRRKRLELSQCVVDRRTGLALGSKVRWLFTGSVLVRPDPSRPDEVYGADHGGTLVSIYPVTAETVLQSNLGMEEESLLDLEAAPVLAPVGTQAKLVVEAPREAAGGGR